LINRQLHEWLMDTIILMGTIALLPRFCEKPLPRYAVMAFLALLLIGGATRTHAQTNEQELKAGFLTLFPQYTTWPASTGSSTDSMLSANTTPSQSTRPIVICVLGRDPFGTLLDQYASGRKGTKPLTVKRIDTPEEAAHCQVVFIAKSETRHEATWLAALKGKPVLTVGESGETIARGGVIAFKQEGQRIRFEVNLVAATSAQLIISSSMLTFASKVYRTSSTVRELP